MHSTSSQETRFRLTEEQGRELAREFGTPLYVVSESHFRDRIRRYRAAWEAATRRSELSYATKANSTLALIRIASSEGCKIDVASEGELRAALAAGVPAADCYFHGNFKSEAELQFALVSGIGTIVVDSFHEIEQLAALSPSCDIVLRLAPGVDPVTHHRIATGQEDTKFGFNIADGSAEAALGQSIERGFRVKGFHCHVGSQLLDPEAQQAGGEILARFAVAMLDAHGFETRYINVGGGLGVSYTDRDEPMPVEDYCEQIAAAIRDALDGRLDPVLGQEPGRALVAEAGVTLYEVGPIKTVPAPEIGSRIYVAVDGGLYENPRPALYDAKYLVEAVTSGGTARGGAPAVTLMEHGGAMTPLASAGPPVSEHEAMMVTVVGKHCEGDTLFQDISLPSSLAPGDLLQVLCTGAYNSSMASNYNRLPRPATILVQPDGAPRIIQRRETWEDLLSREVL